MAAWITEAEELEALYGAQLHASFLLRLEWIREHGADMELKQAARQYVAGIQTPDAPLPVLWLADGVVTPKFTRDALDYLTSRHFLKYIQQSDDIKRGPELAQQQRKLQAWRSGLHGESGLGYGLTSLLRTESDTAQAEASFDVYEEAGIDAYKYNAMLDDKTCERCRELDGRIFLLSEKEPGTNFPKIHPNCRCYIEPVLIME
jgi:SPP1 gp7 family putative phage head morphogenesis protein